MTISTIGLLLTRSNRLLLALWIIAALTLLTMVLVLVSVFTPFFAPRGELLSIAVWESSSLATLLGTFLVLRLSGYRLVWRKDQFDSTEVAANTQAFVDHGSLWHSPFLYLVPAMSLIGDRRYMLPRMWLNLFR